jgi:hypothetical protein
MNGHLIFSLKKTLELLSKKKYFFNNNNIYLTDKIIIYNLLKSKKIKVVCLDSLIKGQKKKKLFIKFYNYFDIKLKQFSNNNKINIENQKINTIYNTYKFDIPRYYVGVKFLLISLKLAIKKYNIKKITYINDLEYNLLDNKFYNNILSYFCKKNKINYVQNRYFNPHKSFFINKLIYFLINLRYIFNDINFYKFSIIFKKIITKIELFKSNNAILILEPALDINFGRYKISKTYFLNINFIINNLLIKTRLKKNKEIISKKIRNINDIFFNYLKNENKSLEPFFINSINIISNYIKSKKIKKIFWGSSPEPFIRNIIKFLMKKFYVNGVQHGGKYFLMEEDICHKDSDFSFCDKFYSYGFNVQFNKRKYANKTKIVNSGSFKDCYNNYQLSKINNKETNNILFVPVGLGLFTAPRIETSQTERFNLQKEICSSLNNINYANKFIKILPNVVYKNINLNYFQLETNPLYFELSKYNLIKVNSNSLLSSMSKLNPRIVVTDYLSTPLYELANSKSEIILFLDNLNYPKKEAMSIIRKRCFIANNIYEMESYIHQIFENTISKKSSSKFYEKFYKTKISINKIF